MELALSPPSTRSAVSLETRLVDSSEIRTRLCEHPDRRQDAAGIGLRRLVAVADRGHRHDRPVEAVAQGRDVGLLPRHQPGSLDAPHHEPGRDQAAEDQGDQRGQLQQGGKIGFQHEHRTGRLAHGDRHARAVSRVGEIDELVAFRRDGDRADGDVETVLPHTIEQGSPYPRPTSGRTAVPSARRRGATGRR